MKKKMTLLLALNAMFLAGCVTVRGFVWEDTNGNGIQDPGEPGLEGVRISLWHEWDSYYYGAAETDSNGMYEFERPFFFFRRGHNRYIARIRIPGGYSLTLPNQGSDNSLDSDFLPPFGWSDTFGKGTHTRDAGLVLEEASVEFESPANVETESQEPAASISDYVWHDEDQDGLQDDEESGVEAAQITLFDADGEQLAQTSTDSNGFYEFAELTPGEEYSLHFDPPESYLLTLQDEGDDDSVDSDPDPETGMTANFVLPAEGTADMDAGVYIQQAAASFCYGPGGEPFPENVNPMTGLPVSEPAYLGLNPVFTSVSIFPPSVRPPTGVSEAPRIDQIYIGDGDSRLLVANYGSFPFAVFEDGEEAESGEPNADIGPLAEDEYVIWGRVWYDGQPNSLEDSPEAGVANVPITLVDINLATVATTTTDSTGFYMFTLNGVALNTEFQVRVGHPPTLPTYFFVQKDVGNDDTIDSDVTSLGRTDFFDPTDDADHIVGHMDAGLRATYILEGFRSARTAFQDIQVNFCGCLVAAGADPTVAAQVNVCANVFGADASNIGGAGIDVSQLLAVAQNYTENSSCTPNLQDAALFCTETPGGGGAGDEVYVQYNINNISHFMYDEALGAYTWWLNTPKSEAERGTAPFSVETEDYTQMIDGLTQETLAFANVVVLMVPHTAQNPAVTIIDLEMDFASGRAFVFRNGMMFEATWSTQYPDYVENTDQPLPVHLMLDGQPFPLAPGQTFYNYLNEFDTMTELSPGIWLADFDAPAYSP